MRNRRRRERAQEQLEQSRQFKQGMQTDRQQHETGLEKKRQAGQTHRTGMTTQAQLDVTDKQSAHGMARQGLSGQQGMELQGLVGQQREGEQTREFGFQRGESALQRQHGMAIQDSANTGAYSRAALGVAGDVLLAGGTGSGRISAATDPRFTPQAFDRASVPQVEAKPGLTRLGGETRFIDGIPHTEGDGMFQYSPEMQGMMPVPRVDPNNPYAHLSEAQLKKLMDEEEARR